MAKSERMSPVDTTWLRMDRTANPMVIVGVLLLDGPVDMDRVERTIAQRLLAMPRFRQRVERRATGYWWAPDPYFSIRRHIKRVRLPGRAGKAELQRFVADLASQQLDMAHPLWDYHIVEKFRGGAAVVVRIHHAIADGIALIGVMLSLTDESPKAPERLFPLEEEEEHGRSPEAADSWRRYLADAMNLVEGTALLSRQALNETRARIARPAETIRGGLSIASELGYLLFMPQDSKTRFKGVPRGEKRVAWTDPIALPEVKIIGKALGCSVNDMLLAAVAGSLRRYLEEKGDVTGGLGVRVLVPVNLRGPQQAGQLGNQFGIVALELPVGIANPLARLYEVRRRMEQLKASYEAPVTLGLLMALGYAPQPIQDRLFNLLLSRASAVMTNVPGPQTPLYLGGSLVSQVMFWVPQAGEISMGISVLTFNGHVQFGVITDAAVIPDPDAVIARFEEEFEQLLYHTLMEPWGGVSPETMAIEIERPSRPKRVSKRRPTAEQPEQGPPKGRRARNGQSMKKAAE
jgi:diacylglycerol O-acyltransferase